jgi:hypothetical protein
VEVPFKVTLVLVRVQERPAGVTVPLREAVPVKPSSPIKAIVDVPVAPAREVTVAGEATIVKSCTVRVTIVEWLSWPFVPVTFRE